MDQIGSLPAGIATNITVAYIHEANVRTGAAFETGAKADIPIVSACVEALQDGHIYVRQQAVRQIRNIGGPSAVLVLVAALNDYEGEVRSCAGYALGAIGDVSAIPALINALKDNDVYVRRAAIFALGAIGDVQAVPALVEALKDDDAFARRDAGEALGKVGDRISLPRKILSTSRLSAQERVEVLEALGRIPRKVPWSHAPYAWQDARTLCRAVLNEGDADARSGAQTVLNWLDGDRNLLIASRPDTVSERQDLLRASQGGPGEDRPETLLRGSSEPTFASSPPGNLPAPPPAPNEIP